MSNERTVLTGPREGMASLVGCENTPDIFAAKRKRLEAKREAYRREKAVSGFKVVPATRKGHDERS